MNVSSALKQVKQLKNELKRKIKMRKENFFMVIPKESTLESFKEQNAKETNFVDFEKISSEISEISDTISNLREKILKTNISIQVELDGKSVTLSRLKLMIDDIRSELAQIDGINEKDIFSSRRRRLATSEEEEKEIAQLTDIELENRIKTLEDRKIKLENILETQNATTQLVD
jgi:hypothetical protein